MRKSTARCPVYVPIDRYDSLDDYGAASNCRLIIMPGDYVTFWTNEQPPVVKLARPQ